MRIGEQRAQLFLRIDTLNDDDDAMPDATEEFLAALLLSYNFQQEHRYAFYAR